MSKNENLNLADLDLNKLKLSDEDALALSYLTPGLSRRIQKQLLAQLTPSEVRKLHRTLSSRTAEETQKEPKPARRSTDRMLSTLPRKYSIDNNKAISDELDEGKDSVKNVKSFLPVKSSGFREEYRPSYEFNLRSSSIGAEPRGDYKFSYRKPTRINKSLSIREPASFLSSKSSDLHSPDSSISESVSRNDDSSYRDSLSSRYSDSSVSRPYSKYSPDSSYSKYVPNAPTQSSIDLKTDTNKPSSRRISRFLRPDFFDGPKEEPKKENVFLKEKKEREMETQKVLKEIRDKRKGRHNLRSERSCSREKELAKERIPVLEEISKKQEQNNKHIAKTTNIISNNADILNEKRQTVHDYVNVPAQSSISAKEPSVMLSNGTDKTTDTVHDYVNVKAAENSTPVVKKERISRIIRPKSYPTESVDNKLKVSPEKTVKDSKISKLKRGFTKQAKEKTKEDKNEENKHINEEDKGHKNKILQSIEKKFEKFRNGNLSASKDPEKVKALQEKKSNVENAIKRLREQSLPPANLEPCTESGLIKRAVSVEDLTGSKPLQASRKSVTKILGLFKKYEEQDKKKPVKKNKSKENGKNTVTKPSNKNDSDKTNESVINQAEIEIVNCDNHAVLSDSSQSEKVQKKERPRSLLLNKEKHFQNAYIGAKSDSLLVDNEKESKIKSKLPVNSFRRSLNLDSLPETPRFYKNPSRTSVNENNTEQRPDKKNLKLDLSRVPLKKTEPTVVVSAPSISSYQLNGFEDNAYSRENRNSLATTDDSSTLLSPGDEYLSCDSWSACSDFHHINDLHSPTSYNGHSMYSGDENESVIDRIRRKSFYTRFNEKKRPRKPSIAHNYKDLDYCKPSSDYSSLDRYRSPSVTRRSSYSSYKPEPTTREYKPYTRSASVLNDYVNVPSSYQTYNSKIGRPSVRGLYPDPEDNALDDLLSTAKSRIHSPTMHRSSLSRGSSVSPVHFVDRPSSSVLSPTTSEPI